MFVKPFKIRLFNQLNKSHCKQFREKCVSSFPGIRDPNFSKDFMTKKDIITLCKITTHNNQLVDVYVVNQVPLFFIYNEQLFPTIYFLWKYPDCLLYFTTHSGVVDKLKGGADLMLPGVVYPKFNIDLPYAVSMFLRNTPVYVNVTTNKAAIAVGVTAESTVVLNRQRNRGKCVIIYHSIDDYLCKINEMQPLPQPQLGTPIPFPVVPTDVLQTIEEAGHSTDNKESSATHEVIEGEMMDDLMLRCLLVAMKYAKDLTVPILLSTFCHSYMKTACPAINIAKSTYGKLTPFMLKCVEDGLIELEKRGNVYLISKFNTSHEMVETYTHNFDQEPKIAVQIETQPEIIINRVWFITQPVLKLFETYGFKQGNYLSEQQVNDALSSYIKHNNLLLKNEDNEDIQMTDYLRTLVSKQGMTMTFGTFRMSVLQHMSKGYVLLIGKEEITRKGELPPINITTAQRNNKCVTIVTHVETYNINIYAFAKDCQSSKGIGVKINSGLGNSSHNHVQLQGNQTIFVKNLLIKKYGVPENWIEVPPQRKK